MTVIPAAVLTALAERRGHAARALFWFVGRDRATGQPAPLGLWTGDDAAQFTINGQPRTYYGPAIVAAGTIRTGIGLNVPALNLSMACRADEVQQALRAYDPRGAQVEIHTVVFALATGVMVGTPFLRWRGRLDELTWTTGAMGDDGAAVSTADLTIVPEADRLTVPLPAFRSDADQQAIYPGDAFFAHAARMATFEVVVGEHKVKPGEGGSAAALSARPQRLDGPA